MKPIPPHSVPHRRRIWLRCVQATVGLGAIVVLVSAIRWAGRDIPPAPAATGSRGATAVTASERTARPSFDLALYEAEVRRMQKGEPYYDAAAAELPARGYPTKSVFNWRQPLPMALIAVLPRPDDARLILGMLGAGILFLGYHVVRQDAELSPAATAWVVLTVFSLLPGILPTLYYSSELWAGNLILLSLLLGASGRTLPAVFVGTTALFFRELALPYCLSAAVAAWMGGRRRESLTWSAGMLVWGAFFAWHLSQVMARIPHDATASRGWLCGGGVDFVLSTAQMHFVLVLLPRWATVVYVTLAAVGFVGAKSELGRRGAAACAAYTAFFALVGQPFNQYWGQLWAPLLCLGVTRSLALGIRFGGGMLHGTYRLLPFSRRFSGTKSAV